MGRIVVGRRGDHYVVFDEDLGIEKEEVQDIVVQARILIIGRFMYIRACKFPLLLMSGC